MAAPASLLWAVDHGEFQDDMHGPRAPAARALEAFVARFGRSPHVIAAAPGRVNLIGDHTDYNRGHVLPMAIDRFTAVALSPANAPRSTFIALDLGQDFATDLRGEITPQPGSFANGVLGVAAGMRAAEYIFENMNAVIASDVPIGAGLSSSAALEVAMATALETLLAVEMDPLSKALLCQRAEHQFVGTPCGIMDMLTSIRGRAGCALLIDCRDNSVTDVRMPPDDEMTVLVADTGVRHELAAGEYAKRRSECERAAAALSVESLCEATMDSLGATGLDGVLRRRAEHVLKEDRRVKDAAAALGRGDLDSLGELMFTSHSSLRDLFEVSCAELDCLVDAAAKMRGRGGVIGARMTGGGFGGCAVVLCRRDRVNAVRRGLQSTFEARYGRAPAVFPVAASDGARVVHAP